ncbi:type IV pilus secretin PilQ [Candidatus Albibeggiatoa sp. nov. NOAA]|uniref:type IV pilus secretin PilQ n=1 Tax=Candidatus Albibeggiatoa sp. nov. NOAA TaxID=3162724 RepID=UPI0032F415F6|nr:type IV pilus secretin PilQ [Thiotrichaceae bacterium]
MKLKKYILYLFYLFVTSLLMGTPAYAVQLDKIGHSALPGNKVQINLIFSGIAPEPLSFSTDNPSKIVLDFLSASLNLKKRFQVIGVGAVQSVNTVETTDRTRVVLNLVSSVPYDIKVQGNTVSITSENFTGQVNQLAGSGADDPIVKASLPSKTLANDIYPEYDDITVDSYVAPRTNTTNLTPQNTVQPSTTSQQPPYSRPTVRQSYLPKGPHISQVDFRRSESQSGLVMITLSNPNIVVDMREEGDDIVIDFLDADLPDKLDRRLDVIDFATPVTHIDTLKRGNNVRVKISALGEYEHLAYQTENTYVIEIKELTPEEKAEKQKVQPTYTGQKVTFSFQKIDVRAALLLLTELPGVNLNLVASEKVQGNVTLRLKNVPWDQALDIILEANGLGMKKVGNVVMVDKREDIAAREKKELEDQQQIKQLEPLRTEYIQINYAKAGDFEALLKSRSGSESSHSFLSARGNVSIDERTNTLILQDTSERLSEIRELLAALDTPVRQVLIESRVVIAEDNFRRALGVRFGYSANQDLGNGDGIVVGGKVGGNTEFSNGTAFTSDNTLIGGGEGENFIVSLPETLGSGNTAALGLAIGKIGSYLLNLELSALQQEGRGEIVASPRVITANQKTATIYQGQQRSYQATAGIGAIAQVQFKDAYLKLEVTPQITPDDRVIMELSVSKDDFLPATGGGEPPISKRQVQTQVLVDNGETVVLGGVYEQNSTNSVDRIPFLSDIPVVGNLFKRRSRSDIKSELLIFVTPKILKEAN